MKTVRCSSCFASSYNSESSRFAWSLGVYNCWMSSSSESDSSLGEMESDPDEPEFDVLFGDGVAAEVVGGAAVG
jgi:hypothetical protein